VKRRNEPPLVTLDVDHGENSIKRVKLLEIST
jgi:hypothetical protein